jgi:tetraacyldisaccharide 4'-kinase
MFSKAEIKALLSEGKRSRLTLVTTEKDMARLRGVTGFPAFARGIVAFAVTLGFDDPAQLRKFVADALFQARERRFRLP